MDNEIRVVIADDQEGMRLILRKMIDKAQGFTICAEADSGDKVPALVEQYKPHVCFLDVEMPGMTGIECAKAIQDMDPHTIIVFATAHEGYMAQAFEMYAFDYMVKPFKMERVMKTLERIREVVLGRQAGRAAARERNGDGCRQGAHRAQRPHHAPSQGGRELCQPVGHPAGAAREPLHRALCHRRTAL